MARICGRCIIWQGFVELTPIFVVLPLRVDGRHSHILAVCITVLEAVPEASVGIPGHAKCIGSLFADEVEADGSICHMRCREGPDHVFHDVDPVD